MEQRLIQIREKQKESWNKFSPGWEKWDELFMTFLNPMGEEMIRQLEIQKTDLVLDIAAGTGEPGLSIAAKLESGRVIITDLSDQMLVVAKKNISRRKIKNVTTLACDVSALPFADNTFDAISCRLGFMFFPDMFLAAKEMLRVLKPGGRISASVWGLPEKNPWITTMMGPISRNIQMPMIHQGAPGVFRCSSEHFMKALFFDAGFTNVYEKEIEEKLCLPNHESYWLLMTEVAAPVVEALGMASDQLTEKIKSEVFESLNKYREGNSISVNSSAFVISAEK